jgi:hypothetical protein
MKKEVKKITTIKIGKKYKVREQFKTELKKLINLGQKLPLQTIT